MFWWRADDDGLTRAVTDRHDGVSAGCYGSLNLGGQVGDDPAAVRANRHTVATALGLPETRLVFMRQCHSARVEVLEGPWSGAAPDCDGVVTTATDLALAVLSADCVPVLLTDSHTGAIAAVHAGRVGLTAGVLTAALSALREVGVAVDVPGRVEAVVGPSVCGRCYEVPAAMCDEVAAIEPATRATSWQDTPALDLAAGVVAQLSRAGVRVQRLPGCTREDADLYSHRGAAGGPTGRFATIVLRYAASAGPR